MTDYICQECGEPCRAHAVNMGIGPYEYWGQRGNDVRMEVVSTCCDAPLLDDDGKEVDEPDLPYGPGDPDYEADSRREQHDAY